MIGVKFPTSSNAANARGFESARRGTQHDADNESRDDREHHFAGGVENEASRNCSQSLQRPSPHPPKDDFGMRSAALLRRDRFWTRTFPHHPSLRRAGRRGSRAETVLALFQRRDLPSS
jgi:hypothetical protein